jgi:hypothetical protein
MPTPPALSIKMCSTSSAQNLSSLCRPFGCQPIPSAGAEPRREERADAALTERDCEQATAQQRETSCSQDEETLGGGIKVVTHETPVASAPGDVADELIKAFGIPAAPEVLDLPAFLPNPFSRMDRVATSTVVGKHGGTSDVEHDARPVVDGRASTFDAGPIPESLRRKKVA